MTNSNTNDEKIPPDTKAEGSGNKIDSSDVIGELFKLYPGAKDTLVKLLIGATSTAVKFASKATEVQSKLENRERRFINIYRSQDIARNLPDESFERVLEFTRSAFEMALKFVSSQDETKISSNDHGKSD